MTLAMLLVLISHHKGLTLLLIVIIALLFIALTPLVKNCLLYTSLWSPLPAAAVLIPLGL